MDTLGGLAFAGEAPIEEYMNEKPKKREEPILNKYMISQIFCSVVFTVGIFVLFLLSPSITSRFRPTPDNIYLLSAFFALFIFTSVFNCFNARTDKLFLFNKLSKNKPFIFIMLLVLSVQIIFIYLGGSVLRTAPLTASELKTTLCIIAPYYDKERTEICKELVMEHRCTSVDNRGYLLLFNNHLPKQQFKL